MAAARTTHRSGPAVARRGSAGPTRTLDAGDGRAAKVVAVGSRSGMRLHLTGYHLASARLAPANGDSAKARDHFEKGVTRIHETGYHRCDRELEELRLRLACGFLPRAHSTLTSTNDTLNSVPPALLLGNMEHATQWQVGALKREVLERRLSTRFPLDLKFDYTIQDICGPRISGSGRTLDISGSGLSFTADRPLQIGQTLEISIQWPVLLDGSVQLQLVVSGAVVRINGDIAAVRFRRREFRTRAAAPPAQKAAWTAATPGLGLRDS